MTDEARKVIETIKQALDVFEQMELPLEERECTLSYKATMALVAELDNVKRERDEAWNVVESISNQNEVMAVAMEKAKCERDAAVECLRKVCKATNLCSYCKSFNAEHTEYVPNDCMDCVNACNWQWRGAKEA